ncbi:hypothetical protein GGC64_001970 [Mycobacterium sp. OAS707]|nr:hypothetical protein [Mycobacterium sp. OAS707]MBE1547962.1 hypothetical protein [Mycobacterium sp. OAS707]
MGRVRRFPQQRKLRFKLPRQPFVIVIKQRNNVGGGCRDTYVPGTASADPASSADDTIRQTADPSWQFRTRFTVVNHDHFQRRSGALCTHTTQRSDELRPAD